MRDMKKLFHQLAKPYTYCYVYLIDDAARIFRNSHATTGNQTHTSSVAPLLRNLIPGCFTDRATAAVAKKVLKYFSTFWSFLAFGRSVPTLQNKFQPVWKGQVIHQEGAAVRRNLLPKLKPRWWREVQLGSIRSKHKMRGEVGAQ